MAVKIQTSMELSIRKRLLAEPSKRLCRNLFGEVDHQELKEDFEGCMKAEASEKKSLWNFDFETEIPLPARRIRWEPVTKGVTSLGLGGSHTNTCILSQRQPQPSQSEVGADNEQVVQESSQKSVSTLRIVNETHPSEDRCTHQAPYSLRNEKTTTKQETKPEKRKRETTITEFMKQRKRRRCSDVVKSKPADSKEPHRSRTRLSVTSS